MSSCQQCRSAHRRCSLAGSTTQDPPCDSCRSRNLTCEPPRLTTESTVASARPRRHLRPSGRDPQPQNSLGNAVSPEPRKTILVALDAGTEFAKAGFCVMEESEREQGFLPANMFARLEPVTWTTNETALPSEVGYVLDKSVYPAVLRPKYGRDLKRAVQHGQIREHDIIRKYKPLVFGEAEGSRTRQQIEKISDELQRCQSAQGLDHDHQTRFGPLDLMRDLLGYMFRYVLSVIAEAHTTLAWPIWVDTHRYEEWKPQENIEIALPLPVATTPEQVLLIKEAAKQAGLPKVLVCGEPAAALMFHLFRNQRESMIGEPVMIMDIGAGSGDFDAWEILSIAPFRVRQLTAPRTEWCGGGTINTMYRVLFLRGVLDYKLNILRSLERSGNPMTWDQLGDRLEAEFEGAKKDFRGTNDDPPYKIHIKGLPAIPARNMPEKDTLHIPGKAIRDAHSTHIDQLHGVIQGALERLEDKVISGTVSRMPRELLLAGGGSNNILVRQEIRRRFETRDFKVAFPSGERCEVTVALGSIILLADKGLMTERIVRRAYCVGRWEEPEDLRAFPEEVWHHSEQDNKTRILMSRFFCRLEQSIPLQYKTSVVGWRRPMAEDVATDDGIVIEERLFYSDTVSDDGIVLEGNNSIDEMPDPLLFKIPQRYFRNFDKKKNRSTGQEWYYLDYEVSLLLDGDDMIFQITIPKHGRFLNPPNRYGHDPIILQGRYDCSGSFKLVNVIDDTE
ncbi:hypothetical protein ABEF95_003870 [Exophiala dermatitidis]